MDDGGRVYHCGAGGGSIAHVNDLGLLNVGPESSGADPGPACYAQGGADATVTDADLALGYLNADNFLGGEMKLRRDLTDAALGKLASKLKLTHTEVAWGICNIVNENMAAAARIHIAEKGHDPRDFTMVATGGAGPVHAYELARILGACAQRHVPGTRRTQRQRHARAALQRARGSLQRDERPRRT